MLCPSRTSLNPVLMPALFTPTSPSARLPRSGFVLRPVLVAVHAQSAVFSVTGFGEKLAVEHVAWERPQSPNHRHPSLSVPIGRSAANVLEGSGLCPE